MPGAGLLLQHVPRPAAGPRGRRADPVAPDAVGLQPGPPPQLHRLLRAGAVGDHRSAGDRGSASRSTSPRTSGTGTCTAPATPTTASTPSTCGTGARTPSSTSGSVIIVGGDPAAVRRLGFRPASSLNDAFELAADVVGPQPHASPTSTTRRSSWPTCREPTRRRRKRTTRGVRAAHQGKVLVAFARTQVAVGVAPAPRHRVPAAAAHVPGSIEPLRAREAHRRRLRHRVGAPAHRPGRPTGPVRRPDPPHHLGRGRPRGARPRPGGPHRRPGDLRGQPPQPPRHGRAAVGAPGRFRNKVFIAAAADYFFTNRLAGGASALALDAIPIERTKVTRRSADLAADLIADGWSMAIFPEGGRSPDGWGQAFRGGAAYLALRCDVPVIPVHLVGHRPAAAQGRQQLNRGSTVVTFGAALRPGRRATTRAASPPASSRRSRRWPTRPRPTGGRHGSARTPTRPRRSAAPTPAPGAAPGRSASATPTSATAGRAPPRSGPEGGRITSRPPRFR